MFQSTLRGCQVTEHKTTKTVLAELTKPFLGSMTVTGLIAVRRWEDFAQLPIERQTVAEHVLSLTKLIRRCTRIVNAERNDDNKLDLSLLTDAALIHDDGEGILAVDISTRFKQSHNVVHEFLAFASNQDKTDPIEYNRTLRAYLLQYCFAEEVKDLLRVENGNAINIIKSLEREKRDEAFFFKLIERLEYILFGLRQYFKREILEVAVSTIDHHLPSLDELCRKVPDFNLVWTPDLRQTCLDLSNENPNVPRT
jgi:5'-deoxynucleotidase YfbR-like HD superfamily hydrolase